MRLTPRPSILVGLFGSLVLPVILVMTACAGDDAGQTAETSGESSGSTETNATETNATETDATETDESSTETGDASCYDGMHAIVSDIDETLTTADSEFLMQLVDSTYDPLERPEGSELINDYHARGYTIVYLTARAETHVSSDDAMIPARELTLDWLEAHGYPLDENTRLILAPMFVFGDATAEYKGQALLDMQAEGFVFDYAYGNAATDITGYEIANIPKDVTFIIGPEAGNGDTVPVLEEGWVEHRAAHMPTVPNFCEG